MSRALVDDIQAQSGRLTLNLRIALETCDLSAELFGVPLWKHLYHTMHSLDQWFINPARYEEPPFHVHGLNSLDERSPVALDKRQLSDYLLQIDHKITAYLQGLTDEQLVIRPHGCEHTRLALILGQTRHCMCHIGIINGATIAATGKWPRVVGMAHSDPEHDGYFE